MKERKGQLLLPPPSAHVLDYHGTDICFYSQFKGLNRAGIPVAMSPPGCSPLHLNGGQSYWLWLDLHLLPTPPCHPSLRRQSIL